MIDERMNGMPRQFDQRMDKQRYEPHYEPHDMHEHEYGYAGEYKHKDHDKLEDLKWLKQNMRGNIEEAKGFAMKANAMREKNPAIADLCKVMMRGHLQFEEEGDDVMRKLVEDYKRDAMHDPTVPGYARALEDERRELREEAQKVRGLVEPGK